MKKPEESIKKLLDPKFYLESFTKIKGKTPGLIPFILNEAQKDLFNAINKNSRVIILKARQIGFCLDPSTKVLTSGLEWVKLDDIKVGQSIVAIDEKISGGSGSARKIQTAVIENKFDVYDEAIKLTMDNGTELIATPSHKFLFKDSHLSRMIWKRVDELKIGDESGVLTEVWGENTYEDGWFGGMIDGEGCLAKPSRTGVNIAISQVSGQVWDRLINYVEKNNIKYRTEIDRRLPGGGSKMGLKEVNKVVISNMFDVLRVMGKTSPSRFKNRNFWDGKRLGFTIRPKIIKIEKLGKRRMIDLQTSKKTYIANGFVSHNSTAAVGYLYHRTITTPGTNTALIGYNSDLTSELLDKTKTFYRTTPDGIRPQIQYNSKYEISFPAIDSKILVLPSSENVGRGYTLHNVLCVSGDTLVFGKNGNPVKVADVSSGDVIVNGNGGGSIVKRIIKKKSIEKMLALDVIGVDGLLKVTESHKILTRNGWKRAIDITTKDHIAYPYFQARERHKEIDFSIYPVKPGSFIKIGKIELNRDFGEICGWFAAEGSVRNNRISFSINITEEDYLVSLVKRVFGNELGKISINRKKGGNGSVVTITSQQISEFFVEKFGSGAINKTISDSCWYYGWEFGYGFLRGVFLGDGYFQDDNRKVVLRSISPSLVYQVKKMLVSLRIGLASIRSNKTNRYGVPGKDVYSLSLSGPGNYKFRRKLGFKLPIYNNGRFRWILENDPGRNYGWKTWIRGKFHYWMKVRSVREIDREEFVYDIVLPNEPHSFLTHAGVVSNCTELAFWEKAGEKMLAIENAVPADGKIIIESTPNGMGNQYHQMWMAENDYCKKKYGWWWGYCLDEETEILTTEGWKKHNDFKIGDEHFTVNLKTKKIEIKKATDKFEEDYKGAMVHFKSSNVDMLVTPNHKCIVESSKEYQSTKKWGLKQAKDISDLDYFPLFTQGWHENVKKKYSDDFVELIGWVITEASFERYLIYIYQNIGSSLNRIETLCKNLGYKYTKYVRKDGKRGEIRIHSASTKKIRKVLNGKCKSLPIGFLLSLAYNQLVILKRTMVMADGHLCTGCKKTAVLCDSKCSFIQKDKETSDNFQILTTLIGYASSIKQSSKIDKCFNVYTKEAKVAQRFSKEYEPYAGKIWCPTNDNGTIVIRRKEKVMVTGQSKKQIEVIRRRINNPMRFAQEYGLEFLSSGRPVFSSYLIKELLKGVYKVGQKVKDDDGVINEVIKDPEDDVTMYYQPKDGVPYIVGVDVAEGVTGGDYSVFTIFDRKSGHEVAFWRGHIAPDKFGTLLDKWGRKYNNALMVVEINNHGLTTVTALKNKMYPQMYFRPMVKMDTMSTSFSDRLGWKTTKVTRPLMIDDLREALSDGSLKIHTKKTFDEMLTFVFNDSSDMVAQSGFNDDCFVKGTKILTNKGQVNIEEIKVGDLVLTREGFKPVLFTRNRLKEVVTNVGLCGTETHPVILADGEQRELHLVGKDDKLHVWNQSKKKIEKLSYIEAKDIIDIQTQKEDICDVIIGDTISGKNHRPLCTDKYGSTILERLKKVIKSIIKTITLSITKFVTLIAYQPAGIRLITSTNGTRFVKKPALYVVENSNAEALGKLSIAVENVQTKHGNLKEEKERVYNLQIGECHEYFANNILVHNCIFASAIGFQGFKVMHGGKLEQIAYEGILPANFSY